MKYLVISDTHGRIERVLKLLPLFDDLDGIIHLGDFMRDAEQIKKLANVKVIAVGGNCDGVTSKKEAVLTLQTPYGPILLTHGHLHGTKTGIDRLLYQALEQDAKAVLFGHTHAPFYGVYEGVSLINPGSLSLPHHGSQGSYAILTIQESGINCSLVNYQEPPKPNKPPGPDGNKKNPRDKKITTGFLRDILNNSDRF